MADNFLEKHYQEYQARKAAMGSGMHTPAKKKAAPVKLQRNVLIAGGCSETGSALVQAFCNEGCKVGFCDADKETGLKLAKDTGSAFFHLEGDTSESLLRTLDTLFKRWKGVDVLILNTAQYSDKEECTGYLPLFEQAVALNLRPYVTAAHRWKTLLDETQEPERYGRLMLLCPTDFTTEKTADYAQRLTRCGIEALTDTLAQQCKGTAQAAYTLCSSGEKTSAENAERVAQLCVFLAQEQGSGLNGQHLRVE